MSENTYLVAGARPWNREVFDRRIRRLPGRWEIVERPDDLTLERLAKLDPSYLFFLHWSWRVPESITGAYECVNFHMTDLPFGRGGSPLQNLIARGHRRTVLTALRMTDQLDAGPVYAKRELSLEGLAEEIYLRVSELAAEMIEQIIRDQPQPQPQRGDAVVFPRRRPEQSEIPKTASLDELFDFLRMLDAEGYPRAFLVHQGYRYEFAQPGRRTGRLEARVSITPAHQDENTKG
jgi:methionyl-tRNA formyltransferase